MRIEDVTSDNIENISDKELRLIRNRCLNIYDGYFAKGPYVKKAVGMDRMFFLKKYYMVRKEMEYRGMKFFLENPLDKEMINRLDISKIWKLDVPALPDMVAIPNYVSVSGEFIKSPITVEKIDVVIRGEEEHRNEGFEAKIGDLVKEQTDKEPNFIYNVKGPDSSFIPLFDLVLKSHDETRKMKAKKEKDVRKLTAAQQKECDEETAKIKENKKLPIASKPHEFKVAQFTHPNGHPRCLICGDEEPVGKVCNMPPSWYEKHEWDDEKAWTEERKKLKTEGKLKKSFPIQKPEETENTIRIPIADCEVTATLTLDATQGIKALYCGKVKKIRTYLFDKKKKAWTMASAKAWVKENANKTEKALGQGRGIGGDRQGVGGTDICICPDCGHEVKHERNTPCAEMKCPECGATMQGKAEKSTMFKIVKVDKKKQIVGGIIYEPDEIDTQGEYADIDEITKGKEKFMENYATNTNRIRVNHKGKRYYFPIIECFQPEEDTIKGGQKLKKGAWWLEVKIANKNIWKMIENNELEGFSMGGTARA